MRVRRSVLLLFKRFIGYASVASAFSISPCTNGRHIRRACEVEVKLTLAPEMFHSLLSDTETDKSGTSFAQEHSCHASQP